jgi:diaminopimelate epimerase
MQFVKMHGLGNDYVYVDGFTWQIDDPAALAVTVSDRHFGIGSDGLILVLPPEPGVTADVRMRMFNADGSEAEMCGNGVRCVCKFAHDRGLATSRPMRVQTGRGVLALNYTLNDQGKVDQVTVDMGEPILEPARVPVDPSRLAATDQPQTFIIDLPGTGERLTATFVSMGNPHAVLYVPRLADVDWHRLGPALETHPAFPRRMNVHFVQVQRPDAVTVVHWERGSGPTLACGTGACAVAVAGVLTCRTARRLTAHLPGGELVLEWRKDGRVDMTGPAVEVYTGDWPG